MEKKKKPPPRVKPPGRPPRIKAVRLIRVPVNDDLSARFERARTLWEQDNPALDSSDAVIGRILILKGLEAFEREHSARRSPELPLLELTTKKS